MYFFVWCYRLGKDLSSALKEKATPSMWWFVVPGGAYYWIWGMTGSLDIATGHRIKQTDTFLLYVLLTLAGAGTYGWYGPRFSGSETKNPINWHSALIVAAIILAMLILIGITLHAVYMSIVQRKITRIRAGAIK